MPDCTPGASLALVLAYVLPPLGALLSATALLVASKARSTSEGALSTSQAAAAASGLVTLSPAVRESLRGAQDRRKS
jgi:hypothetical protein